MGSSCKGKLLQREVEQLTKKDANGKQEKRKVIITFRGKNPDKKRG